MHDRRFVEAIREAISDEMARDPRVVVIGEDVGFGGVFRATDGLRDRFGDDRVMDTPLAESGIVGAGVGAALNGLIPVVEIQFADFIFGAMEQITSEAATLCYRTNGELWVPMVIRAPFGGPVHGGLWHSQSVEAFFTRVAGLKVVIPSNPYDAKGLLIAAIRDPNPVLFFEHKAAYFALHGDVPEDDYVVPIGAANVAREGSDLTIVTYGMMVNHALAVAETLANEDISIEVLDLRTLAPLDRDAMLDSARKTSRVLVAHEDKLTGGVGAEIAAIISTEAFEDLDAPVTRMAAPDVPLFPYSPLLEEYCYPGRDKLEVEVRRLLAY